MKKLIVLGAVAALAIAMACGGGDKGNPAAPSANSTSTDGNLGPDGSTLKVTGARPRCRRQTARPSMRQPAPSL